MNRTDCPSGADLRELALGGSAGRDLQDHLETCVECREAVWVVRKLESLATPRAAVPAFDHVVWRSRTRAMLQESSRPQGRAVLPLRGFVLVLAGGLTTASLALALGPVVFGQSWFMGPAATLVCAALGGYFFHASSSLTQVVQ